MEGVVKVIEEAVSLPAETFCSIVVLIHGALMCNTNEAFVARFAVAVALGIILHQHIRQTNMVRWDRLCLQWLYRLIWLPQSTFLAALWLSAWRAFVVRQKWPEAWIDDPHYICRSDALYQVLHRVCHAIEACAGVAIVLFFALLLHLGLRGLLTLRYVIALNLAWFLTWVVFVMEPGRRLIWWND